MICFQYWISVLGLYGSSWSSGGLGVEVTFKEFYACGYARFLGRRKSIMSMRWIYDVESTFLASFFPTKAKVRFETCMLCDGAGDWWCDIIESIEPGAIEFMTWEDFVTRFKKEFVRTIEVQQLAREYMAL